MSIIDKLNCHEIWISFLELKVTSGNLNKSQIEDLTTFVQRKEYIPVVEKIRKKENFLPPFKVIISKQYSSKKRIVYTYSREENYVLKLLTYLLIRQYDYIFAKNLYSFRANHGVKKAINYLSGDLYLSKKYVYKVDIHNYFNSIDVSILFPILRGIMGDEPEAYSFIERLLTDSRVILSNGEITSEDKGIMAGSPLSSFLANVYLYQLDWYFFNKGNRYARYSDDIIIFAHDENERKNDMSYIYTYLANMSLSINKEKEYLADPYKKWEFLGVSYCNGIFDISEVSANKLKKKMWRKSRALLRWKNRKQVENVCAVKAFIKSFNKKLYDNPITPELTWTRWYFPIINTTDTIGRLDRYMQDCIRYIATEKRTKKRFVFSYDMMKSLGYRSLVHEYYNVKRRKDLENE